MRKNKRGKGQFIVEDKEEEERRKSEQSVLNGSESEVSKSASLKDRHARDTYSVASSSSSSSSSSSTSSSSSRSSKTFFRDPKDESKMTAKRKKCSKDDMVLLQEEDDDFFMSKNTTANKALTPSVSQSSSSALSIPQISLLIPPQSSNKYAKDPRSSIHASFVGMKRRKEKKKNTDFLSLNSSLISERMQTLIIVCNIALLDDKLFEEEVKDVDVMRGVEEGENERKKERKEQ